MRKATPTIKLLFLLIQNNFTEKILQLYFTSLFRRLSLGYAMAGLPNVVSSFPSPPAFYKLFFASPTTTTPSSDDPLDRFRQPPLPPDEHSPSYSMFGNQYTVDDEILSLETQGRKRLYPEHTDSSAKEASKELLRLNKALLFNFLELLNTLLTGPQDGNNNLANQKVTDIEEIAVNIHHLINCYRPHQARQVLIEMLRDQINRRNQTVYETEKQFQVIEERLNQVLVELNANKQLTPNRPFDDNEDLNIRSSASLMSSQQAQTKQDQPLDLIQEMQRRISFLSDV